MEKKRKKKQTQKAEKKLPRIKIEVGKEFEMVLPQLGHKHKGFFKSIEPIGSGQWRIVFKQSMFQHPRSHE